MRKKIIGFFIMTLFLSLSINSCAHLINNFDPETPDIPTISGPADGELYQEYEYTITSTDPQDDDIYFVIRCSDCPSVCQSDWCTSGETMIYRHCWDDYYQRSNPFVIFAKAVDSKGYASDWGTFEINIEQIERVTFPFLIINYIIRAFQQRITL